MAFQMKNRSYIQLIFTSLKNQFGNNTTLIDTSFKQLGNKDVFNIIYEREINGSRVVVMAIQYMNRGVLYNLHAVTAKEFIDQEKQGLDNLLESFVTKNE